MTFIEFIKEHAAEAWMVWGAIITIASVIVKVTPTKKDDKVFEVVFKILNALALNPNVDKEEKENEDKKELEEELDERDDNTTRDNLIDVLK